MEPEGTKPHADALWESKIPAFENITVPAYIVASYSHKIHTPGTCRGWRSIAATEQWLRSHNTMEWPDFYDEAHSEDLRGKALSGCRIRRLEHRPAVGRGEDELRRGVGEGRVSCTIRVGSATEFIGYVKARLWLEAEGSDDMDVFVFVKKLNAEGEPLEPFNVRNHGTARRCRR